MKRRWTFSICAAILEFAACGWPAAAQPSSVAPIGTISAPGDSPVTQGLPDSVIAWEAETKSVDVAAGQDCVRFSFGFTNVSGTAVTILSARPSCGCTTVELPPVPWTIGAGSTGQIKVSVDLAGKSGTLFKTVKVATDKGSRTLSLHINLVARAQLAMTDAMRAAGIAAAKVDRQAVFKGECASCHLKNVQASYGKMLYDSACAICHEAGRRSTMVPDLYHLPAQTGFEFWRSWIASGREGTLMPAFAAARGGPLDDDQIASLAAYLNATIPSN
jgi:mono/diheme cytochrome c family protein